MATRISEQDAEARRLSILQGARWCFLNFGFAKTSLDDIAKRAGISRTLLYKNYRDKEDIFAAVFTHWLVSRHPEAKEAAAAKGSKEERLLDVCRLMVFEPYEDMVGAPMAAEFYTVCERVSPEVSEEHRQVVLNTVASILKDQAAAEVFVLAMEGMLADDPTLDVLIERTRLLVNRFAKHAPRSQ